MEKDPVAEKVQTAFFGLPITQNQPSVNPGPVQNCLCELEFKSL